MARERLSSLQIRKWYRTQAPHYARHFAEGDKFWQPKYYAFTIEIVSKIEEKLSYMHLNPVRADLVKAAIEWKWSSARWYEWHKTVGVPIAWPDV